VLCESSTVINAHYSSLTKTSWQIRLLVKAHAFLTISNQAVDASTSTAPKVGQASQQNVAFRGTESNANSAFTAAEIASSNDQHHVDERMTNEVRLEQHGALWSESNQEHVIDAQYENTSTGEEPPSTRDRFLERLEYCIRNALIGMLDSLTEASLSRISWDSKIRFASGRDRLVRYGESKLGHTFVTMSVWYVMRYCERALNSTFRQTLDSNIATLEKRYQHDIPTRKRRQVWDGPELRNSILHWYHFGCLRQILEWLSAKATLDDRAPTIRCIALIETRWRKHTEMIASSQEKGQLDTVPRYTSQEEEVDRLVLMSEELGFESSGSKTSALIKQVSAKIAARKPTTQFSHPHIREADEQNIPSTAPWELLCLNHHTALSLQLLSSAGTDGRYSAAINREKKNCFLFRQSDNSFMPTWDRSEPCMIAQWWDAEATNVTCATFLDIRKCFYFRLSQHGTGLVC
jgi:hypothetical protein